MSDDMLEFENKIGTLTQSYSHFLKFFCGYGNILAGGVIILIFLVNWQMKPSLLTTGITIISTLSWLIGNNLIRYKYDTSLGIPIGRKAGKRRTWQRDFIEVFSILGGMFVAMSMLATLGLSTIRLTTGLSLLITFVLLILMRLSLRSPTEIFIGVTLWAICIEACEGQLGKNFSVHPKEFLLLALFLILMGTVEHWYYQFITKRFKEA